MMDQVRAHASFLAVRVRAVLGIALRAIRGQRLNDDPWLDRWLPLIPASSEQAPVLELGCGSGRDTATLVAAGHHVVAIDLDPGSIQQARRRAPEARFHCQDVRAPFPLTGQVPAVVASLSLHYFSTGDTRAVIDRIRSHLQDEGVVLCRLNSVNDLCFGAPLVPSAPNAHRDPHGQVKRFFDRDAAAQLFEHGWTLISIEEKTIHRYVLPKVVWEICVRRGAEVSQES